MRFGVGFGAHVDEGILGHARKGKQSPREELLPMRFASDYSSGSNGT
jgi:hypothetical protein